WVSRPHRRTVDVGVPPVPLVDVVVVVAEHHATTAWARAVSSATRSALTCAPATLPWPAALITCALGSMTLPATHTPGTAVRPVGSAGTWSPMPEGCSTA